MGALDLAPPGAARGNLKAYNGVVKLGRTCLTTGQVAKILAVATRTVCKLFDAGILKGYIIPCTGKSKGQLRADGTPQSSVGGDRRILKGSLISFAQSRGLPLPAWLLDKMKAESTLTLWPDAVSPIQLGSLVAQMKVTGVVVGCSDGLWQALEVAKAVTAMQGIPVGILISDDYADRAVEAKGYPTFLSETIARMWMASLQILEEPSS